MAWLEIHTALVRHRKVKNFARALKITPIQAIGHLVTFWAHVLELAEDGDISKWTLEDIASYSGWDGDAKEFYEALSNKGDGFLDEFRISNAQNRTSCSKKIYVHDWYDYAIRYFKMKYKTSHPENITRLEAMYSEMKNRRSKGRLKTVFSTSKDNLQTAINQSIISINHKTLVEHFEDLWKRYPGKGKVGKKHALRYFLGSVKSEKDLSLINKALDNYLSSGRVKRGFVQNGATWFNNWEDWVNYEDTTPKEGSVWDRKL